MKLTAVESFKNGLGPGLVRSSLGQALARRQGSKNWPSPIRLGRVVTASVLTESKPIPDTTVCIESVQLGINRLNLVNSAEFPR